MTALPLSGQGICIASMVILRDIDNRVRIDLSSLNIFTLSRERLVKRIALLILLSSISHASDNSLIRNIETTVGHNCEARSQDVKSAVILRDKGVSKEDALKRLKRPEEPWSIGMYFIDQIYELQDKSPENFYAFSLHTCRVHYWKTAQEELCPLIFSEDAGKQCLIEASKTAKRMMLHSFKHLSVN